ncbi:MAG: hypothetical protein ACRDYD_12180 [Acidimicrobiales bacterium]
MMGGLLAGLSASDGPLVDVVGVYKRAFVVAGVLALAVVAASAALGHWMVGPGAVLGVLAGAGSNRAFQTRTLAMMRDGGRVGKRPLASSVLVRLGIVTAVVLYLIYALPPLGWGMMAGIAAFQLALLGAALGSLLRLARGAAR